jgi:short-subunit dehydrogenase
MIKNKNIVIIGSSSELAQEVLQQINLENSIFSISLKESNETNHLKVSNYLEDATSIVEFISSVDDPIVVFFNGYLAENRPLQNPSSSEIVKTLEINYVVPYNLTAMILKNNINISKFVFISSFAAVKQRNKNFVYGYSKKLLEDSIMSLKLNNYLFIRFGKIKTSMSINHNSSFLDLDKKKAANIIVKFLEPKSGIVYPNVSTKLLSIFIKVIPSPVIKYFNI